MGELVKEIVQFDLSGSNVIPVFTEAKDLWMADVDKGQIQQVFSNLAINAAQAMPDGGHLYITMENAIISDNIENLGLNLIPGNYIRILVQDEGAGIAPKDLDLICKILKRCGYSTQKAKDGRQAIALFQQAQKAGTPFDLVIMDLTIPGGMGGKEAVKELLTLDPGIRAIVSSGYADDPVMANPVEFGFVDKVEKPYTRTLLEAVVDRVLNGGTP